MKNFKLLLCMVLLGCFPSFEPEKIVKKEIKERDIYIKWIKLRGTLDQNFPDYITIQQGNILDTICVAHNIGNVSLKEQQLYLYFVGSPQRYGQKVIISNEVLNYKVNIDTLYVRK